MNSIVELRKQELAGQIKELMNGIEQVISSYSQYGRLEEELGVARGELDRIRTWFNPQSNDPKAFETCIFELIHLEREAKKIQTKGEAEKRRLGRNAASSRDAGTWAGVGATLGGIVLGLGGCISCVSNGTFQPPDSSGPNIHIPLFNLITGLLIGVGGGAAIGALSGALKGQMSERESGDSSFGIWLSTVGIVISIVVSIWMLNSIMEKRPLDPTGRFWIESECNTPCRMEVGDPEGQYFNTDQKAVLVKFSGRKEWVRYGGPSDQGVSPERYSPGIAEFISPENAPSVRVQVLRKR